jgi:hypothetical protein
MPDQHAFESYLRANLSDLEPGQRAPVEKQLRALEVQQKMGHGIFVLSKPKTATWRSGALFEYFSQFADCSIPAPIPDPLRPGHMVAPSNRHLSMDNPVFDTHFFPSVVADGAPATCATCGKRIMSEKHRAFHDRFLHPTDVQLNNQQKYGLGTFASLAFLLTIRRYGKQ